MFDDEPENESGELDIMELIRSEDDGIVGQIMPEKALMLAILASALLDVKEDRFRHASLWIDENDDSYVFSFVNICNQCGLDVESLRAAIRRKILH